MLHTQATPDPRLAHPTELDQEPWSASMMQPALANDLDLDALGAFGSQGQPAWITEDTNATDLLEPFTDQPLYPYGMNAEQVFTGVHAIGQDALLLPPTSLPQIAEALPDAAPPLQSVPSTHGQMENAYDWNCESLYFFS